jgi:glutamyl-tRNA reductase
MDASPPDLHLLGISFRTAGEAVREGLAFSPSQAAELLARARAELPGMEAVVLSTCNRTEFYLSGLPGDEPVEAWHGLLRALRPAAPALDDGCTRYRLRNADAFRHLLRVVCGLDSALLGDGQIPGQLRRALSTAQEAGTLGGVLSPALATALRVGRQARSQTTIGVGTPGVGGAVAEALALRHASPEDEVLVLGSGQAARAVTRALVKAGRRRIVVSGRNAEAAAQVASECGATPLPWAERGAALRSARVVVAATAADAPVLTALPAASAVRLVVDAGFPRQVVPWLPGAEVVSLLELTQVADEAAQQRQAAVPAVEALVAEHVAAWQLARAQAPLEQAIKQLHADAAQLAREAAADLTTGAGRTAADVERLLARQVRRMLHGHVERLRSLHPVEV